MKLNAVTDFRGAIRTRRLYRRPWEKGQRRRHAAGRPIFLLGSLIYSLAAFLAAEKWSATSRFRRCLSGLGNSVGSIIKCRIIAHYTERAAQSNSAQQSAPRVSKSLPLMAGPVVGPRIGVHDDLRPLHILRVLRRTGNTYLPQICREHRECDIGDLKQAPRTGVIGRVA